MLVTQMWGTIFGGFVNYVVMVSIVDSNKALLANGNGNASWSGATMQGYNSNATSWALAKYLYKFGDEYYMVPMGMLIGGAMVVVHWLFSKVSLPSAAFPPSTSLMLTCASSSG